MTEARAADATPSKAFFIDMLTRDITVADAILDLVDNAVDKAVELDQLDVTGLLEGRDVVQVQGRSIDISLSGDHFSITDTCGGIDLDEAQTTAFLFGNPSERGADFGLSVYGIGMKRAFFKLGTHVLMESRTEHDWWRMDWPIETWRDTTNWEIPFEGAREADQAGATGTTIRVDELLPAIRQRFAQEQFQRELRLRLASTYALFLRSGVSITVNGTPVIASLPRFAMAPVAPARHEWTSDGVASLLIVGVTPQDDQSPRGWYVFCNGRMVLEGDKSIDTGWGDVLPQFRSKYNHFLGHLYFRSADVRLLPWRTTKQGVERESVVYQQALAEVRVYSRPVINFLNDLYPSDTQVDVSLERATLQQAQAVEITALPTSEATFHYSPPSRQPRLDTSIQYRRLKADVERIRRYLGDGTLSAGAVGAHTFDYFLEQLGD